jgi:hypothetical protein
MMLVKKPSLDDSYSGGEVRRTLDEGVISVSWNLEARRDFAEQRDDGLARVTTDDGDGSLGGVLMAGELLGEGFGTDDIQGSHAEQTLRVENPGGLEDLGSNGNGRVDRVGDDESESLGAELGNTLDEIAHDAGIDLEEVITGHARLAYSTESQQVISTVSKILTGNAGRNDNNIGTGQGVLQAIILGKVAGDFLQFSQIYWVLAIAKSHAESNIRQPKRCEKGRQRHREC